MKHEVNEVFDIPVRRLDGRPANLRDYKNRVLLIVNVASKCGRTPQYAGLQRLYERFSRDGLTVLGFPCNQFNNEEPGSAADIEQFCTTNYGVTFPLFEKIDVNGPQRHALYAQLCATPDDDGQAGDVGWNFEKFLIDRNGNPKRRFRKTVEPEDARIVEAIEAEI
ncbi:MAG TPA: glutathione peroxidase [Nitrospira sp.]|nr:glutathione peroxidase [Nitrospira sp.]